MEVLKEIKSKIEQNKEEKRTKLLENAYELFETKGFKKTSIQDIVDKAGVAKGTFYLYFKNKEDIRNHLVAEKSNNLFKRAIDALKTQDIDQFDEQIIFVINHVIDDLQNDNEILSFINRDLSLGFYSHEISKIFDDNALGLYDLFVEGVKTVNKGIDNVDIVFFMIVELIGTTCYHCLHEQIPCDMETYKPYLYKAIRAIIHSA